jgi:hypothetical protein
MSMSWHTLLDFTFDIINIPTVKLVKTVVKCGNISGKNVDKIETFAPKVVKAWINPKTKSPKTIHHRGKGVLMIAGDEIRLRSKIK